MVYTVRGGHGDLKIVDEVRFNSRSHMILGKDSTSVCKTLEKRSHPSHPSKRSLSSVANTTEAATNSQVFIESTYYGWKLIPLLMKEEIVAKKIGVKPNKETNQQAKKKKKKYNTMKKRLQRQCIFIFARKSF